MKSKLVIYPKSGGSKKNIQSFGWVDWTICIFMLVTCLAIGIFFAYRSRTKKINNRRKNTNSDSDGYAESEYLVGGRKMKIFPVSMSLIASWISGISLIGTTTETYVYGTGYAFIFVAMILAGIAVHFIFLPVIIELKITSIYEYLEIRFDRKLRLFGSISWLLGMITCTPVVIYATSLAFNLATGVNIHKIIPVTCIICIFYTAIGGIKAVIWTDVLQTFLMFGTMISIAVKGTIDIGGFLVVWKRNYDSQRIEYPPFSTDLTIRHSVLSILVGGTIYWMQLITVNQSYVQRYLSVSNTSAARKSFWLFIFGVVLTICLCSYNGLLMYAANYNCDPFTTKLVKAKDEILPFYVMQIFSNMPGFRGVFIAGIFSAALSSLSTVLNSVAAIVLQDLIKPYLKQPMSDSKTNFLMRTVVVCFGALTVLLSYLIERLGIILQFSMSLMGVITGPVLAIFFTGLLVPWIKSKSVLVGGIIGLILMSWVTMKTQYLIASGDIQYESKPVSTQGCTYNFSSTYISELYDPDLDDEKTFYHMSYLFYACFGAGTTVIVSFISSIIFGFNKPGDVNPATLAPFIRKYFNSSSNLEINESLDVTTKFIVE